MMTLEHALVAGIAALASAVGYLFAIMVRDKESVSKRLQECERERYQLFLLIARTTGETVKDIKTRARRLEEEDK